MRTHHLTFLALILALGGCAPQPTAAPAATQPSVAATQALPTAPADFVELNVFAAASLTAAFSEIGQMFDAAHPGVSAVFNFAGSQQLAQQINEGAPVDVFASANETQMNVVIVAGGIVRGAQQTFVKNRLVVVYPNENPAGLQELADLAAGGLKIVFAAKEVPVGQYSLDFLDKAAADTAFGADFKQGVLANIVSYEDNVKAVLAKVALGEADAGIVYTSDISGEDAGKVSWLEIPDALNVIASYPIAPVKESEHPDLARDFIELVLSPEGQAILAKYNFIPVK
jgi:molybdate transport system substrate-binding protein